MVHIHHRAGILIRWFHRCPKCEKWGCLQCMHKDDSMSGVHYHYVCRQCGHQLQDWKPSDAVKF